MLHLVKQSQQPNEVEEVIKDLKKNPGFSAYMVMNNDGIVIKYENMTYQSAVHHAALVLDLTAKSNKYLRELLEPPDVGLKRTSRWASCLKLTLLSPNPQNEVESLRLRTQEHEMIIAQHSNFTLVVIQDDPKKAEVVQEEAEERKE